jgi:glutamyl-tRNA(Gln) amidotransferase subunit E
VETLEKSMKQSIDYEAAGLIAGLEVHQQLLTDEKLFCRCPAGVYTTDHDGEVLRHMRPTLSELGEYDGTALMEFKTKKQIYYLLNRLNVCTYEMDDTPPFLVNQDAVDSSIKLCLMMGMDIVDEMHISRKQYLDGSIPTGFQRTAIVGVNGQIPFRGRRLTVTHLSLEEDSCREVEDRGHRIIFRTDRLGMPLTETVTGPDLRTPEEVRDAILLCGLVARSTRCVRTGIGAARQDINVSVRGGSRVEIKGVPRAGAAVGLVHNEAVRQMNLLELRDKLRAQGLRQDDDVRMHAADVSDLLEDLELPVARESLRNGAKMYGVKIAGLADLANHPTQPDKTFLDELTGRIRVIACLDEFPILLDRLALHQLPRGHRTGKRLERRLRAGDGDAYYLVWGPEEDCLTAADEIRIRWVEALEGVPMETRQALAEGYTTFERILPGPNRMYPDTDSPPTKITTERVEDLRAQLPPPPWERIERYNSWGVPLETTKYLIRRGGADTVDVAVRETGIDGCTAAVEIGQRAKALRRSGVPVDGLKTEHWVGIFKLYVDGKIPREGIREVAATLARDPGLTADEARVAAGIDLMEPGQLQAELDRIDVRIGLEDSDGDLEKQLRRLAGQALHELAGRASAKTVVENLTHRLRELKS